jgi:hypothetical protein
MTSEQGEEPELYDYSQLCADTVIDGAIPMVSASALRVAPSRYGCYRGGAVVNAVGDALTATEDIAAGQAIATFTGTLVTMEQARAMQEHSQGQYLIQIGDDEVLDCRLAATARPPQCYASNANQAQGLVLHGRILTINHNNAAVELSTAADGTCIATLYAVVRIPATHEIMWSYGEEFEAGFEVSQSSRSSLGSEIFSDEEGERNTSVRRAAMPPDELPQRRSARLQARRPRLTVPEWEVVFSQLDHQSEGDVEEM